MLLFSISPGKSHFASAIYPLLIFIDFQSSLMSPGQSSLQLLELHPIVGIEIAIALLHLSRHGLTHGNR